MKFDTFEYCETLKAGGFTEQQSKAQAQALSKILSSPDITNKNVISELKSELKSNISELQIELIKWNFYTAIFIIFIMTILFSFE